MVAAFEVDGTGEPVNGGNLERIDYDSTINGAVQIFGRDGDDIFVLDDTLVADRDLRRRRQRPLPGRPGLPVRA